MADRDRLFWRAIVGYRDDLNLKSKWWHRLITVLYAIAAVVVGGAALYIAYSTTEPEARIENIDINARLGTSLTMQTDPTLNVAKAVADLPGRLGLLQNDGSVNYLGSYLLGQSFCTKLPLQATQELADFLNTRDFRSQNTKASALQTVQESPGSGKTPLCWFHPSIRDSLKDHSWDDVINYTFTKAAVTRAKAKAMAVAAGILLGIHLVLSLIYYRGFVYIVCGPRQKPTFAA